MSTPIPETGDQRAIFNAARVLGLLLSFQDMQTNLAKNLGPMWWWKVRDLQDSLNGILDKACGGNRTTTPPPAEYGSTDSGWAFIEVAREIKPEEQRLFTMLAKAFGAWHPATEDMIHLILSRPADYPHNPAGNENRSQHDRDSAELRRLCGERDTARRERDEARAQLAKLMAQQANQASHSTPLLFFGFDPGAGCEATFLPINGQSPTYKEFEALWGADPCPGCMKGGTCSKPTCGRAALPDGHPYKTIKTVAEAIVAAKEARARAHERGASIKATMFHDAGAYAECGACGRYSDDHKTATVHTYVSGSNDAPALAAADLLNLAKVTFDGDTYLICHFTDLISTLPDHVADGGTYVVEHVRMTKADFEALPDFQG